MSSRTTRVVRLPLALTAVAVAVSTAMATGAAHAAPAPGAAARSAQAAVAGAPEARATDELNFGDLDGDGRADLAAVDSAGRLWVYPGRATVYPGTGTRNQNFFAPRFQAGSGWGNFTALVRHGDWNNDGRQDILARDSSGRLFLCAGTGQRPGVVSSGVQVGTGWNVFLDIVGVGDADNDGFDDLMGRRNGALTIYYGTGNGLAPFRRTTATAGSGWIGSLLTTVGDWTGDGNTEFMFRVSSGQIRLYRSSSNGFPSNQNEMYFASADGASVVDLVGTGNLTSDAVIGGTPVTRRLPDVAFTDTGGYLWVLAPDTADDFEPLVGSGWGGYSTC
jgi:hypothetical protein